MVEISARGYSAAEDSPPAGRWPSWPIADDLAGATRDVGLDGRVLERRAGDVGQRVPSRSARARP